MNSIESNFLVWLLLWLLLWQCYIVIHELGHAVTALFLTSKEVDMYLGTYMKKENTIAVHLGRLRIYMLYKPPVWIRGCCFSPENISTTRHIVIILAGPIVPLAIALLLFFALPENAPVILSKTSGIFLFYALWGFAMNLIPNTKAASRGGRIANDGALIWQLLRHKRYPRQWGEAVEHFRGERYSQSADGFISILDMGIEHEDIYRYAITALIRAERYDESLQLHSAIESKYGDVFGVTDYTTMSLTLLSLRRYSEALTYINAALDLVPDGVLQLTNRSCILLNLNRYEEALADANRANELEPNNAIPLNNRGYVLYKLGRLQEAFTDTSRAIDIEPNLKNALTGRAYVEIDLGRLDEAYNDIQRALAVDKNYGEAYNALGRYYFAKHDYKAALENFEQAHALDNEVDDIERYLTLAREKVAAEVQQA